MKMIDLHLHTTESDGTYSPREVVEEAERKDLSIISITDHNSVAAYDQLAETKITIIKGCEITTTYNGEVVEVLGYNIDIDIMRRLLNENVLTFEQKQLKEFELIRKRFEEIGVKFDINNIVFDSKKESCRAAFQNEIRRYEENFRFFLEEESKTNRSSFTRNEIYNPKSPLYVDESSLYPSLERAISMVHESGGLAFLAHLYAYSPTIAEELENLMKNYKFDGIECFYTTFNDEQTTYLLDYCNNHNLYKSGGSDFHGANKVNHNIGVGTGNMSIDESLIADWYN
jgi:predicted metal-dependent phosphoesterase TrpH